MEKTMEMLEVEFEKTFRKFLIDLRKIRGEYLPHLGSECIQAVVADVGRRLEKEFNKS